MESPESFEKRQESETETYGEETATRAEAATPADARDRDGRFEGGAEHQPESDAEEYRSDG